MDEGRLAVWSMMETTCIDGSKTERPRSTTYYAIPCLRAVVGEELDLY
jgi:hypothetical protein